MKRLFATVLLVSAFSTIAPGQIQESLHDVLEKRIKYLDEKDEFSRLLDRLNLPLSTPIYLAKNKFLPESSPLKVYIATGSDTKSQKHFIELINKWNTKDGKIYGVIEVVSDISDADIILARFISRDDVTKEIEKMKILDLSVKQNNYAFLYGYVITRKADGLEVLDSYKGLTSMINLEPTSYLLREKFFKLLKKPAKAFEK